MRGQLSALLSDYTQVISKVHMYEHVDAILNVTDGGGMEIKKVAITRGAAVANELAASAKKAA